MGRRPCVFPGVAVIRYTWPSAGARTFLSSVLMESARAAWQSEGGGVFSSESVDSVVATRDVTRVLFSTVRDL